jgi:hypothetical protein
VHEARRTRGTAQHTTPKTRRNSAVNVKKNISTETTPHHTKNKGKQRCEFKKKISTEMSETTPHHTKSKGKQRCEFWKKYLNWNVTHLYGKRTFMANTPLWRTHRTSMVTHLYGVRTSMALWT